MKPSFWRVSTRHTGPSVCVSAVRQLSAVSVASAGVAKGGYVLADVKGGAPQVVLMSSGSEVALALSAAEKLAERGVEARVVSLPSHELFAHQEPSYRDEVLPRGVPRVAIEAAHPMSWYRWVGDNGVVLGIDRFGASAPYETIYEELGITVDKLVDAAEQLVGVEAK